MNEKRRVLPKAESDFIYSISIENPVFLIGLLISIIVVAFLIYKTRKNK